MRTKIIIGIASILLGGTATAASVALNINPLTSTAAQPQSVVQPAQQEQLPQSAKDANAAAADATAAQDSSNVNETSDPVVVAPVNVNKPAPKPATIYANAPSAATPCRLPDQNVYTNDCSAQVKQPDPAPQPVDANPAPADNSATAVTNQN